MILKMLLIFEDWRLDDSCEINLRILHYAKAPTPTPVISGSVELEDMMGHERTGEQTAKRLVSLERQGNPSMVKARRAPTPLWYNLIL